MQRTIPREKRKGYAPFPLNTILIICIAILGIGPSLHVSAANARRGASGYRDLAPCSSPAQPDSRSVLLVLLDRSGSLKDTTDPFRYSTSITRALADLWPGIMIVIPFGDPHLDGANPSVPLLPVYRANLSDATQRATLKAEVETYPILGGTPLAPAMAEALDPAKVLELQSPPGGSRAIIITDGSPEKIPQLPDQTPERQIQEITSSPNLIAQFHDRCIPISPFGLKTDPKADTLLDQIATGTGGKYSHVRSPKELADKVIGLYHDWLGLKLYNPSSDTQGSYSVFVNDFASHADIVVFRPDNTYQVQLFDSDGKTPIGATKPRSIDVHYQIYGLEVPPSSLGTYEIKVLDSRNVADKAAQVYALVNHSRLQVNLIRAESTNFYANQPLTIKAALFKDQKQYVPTSVATLSADITYHVDGQADKTFTQNLVSQDGQGVFSHSFPASTFPQPGQLGIVIHATYQEISEYSQVYTVPLLYFCNKGQLQCFWEQYHAQVLSIGIPLFILLLLLTSLCIWYVRWHKKPEPFGYLVHPNNDYIALELGKHRPLYAHLFRKRVITMQELAKHSQDSTVVVPLCSEPLAFEATKDGIFLRLMQGTSSTVSVITGTEESKRKQTFSEKQRRISLGSYSKICQSDNPAVIYQQETPPNLASAFPLDSNSG